MFIETYQVERIDGRKVIHYNGFTWARDDDELPFALTEGTFCYVEIGDSNYERACEEFERVAQYQHDMTLGELLDYEADCKSGKHLHMDDVTQDTPCGYYWFELDE